MADESPPRLRPPPRPVPPGLARAMVANRAVVWGSVSFAAGSAVLAVFVLAGDPSADWRLDARHQQAPGRVERVELALWAGAPYRHAYAFRLPDGRSIRGVSYAEERLFDVGRPDVPVEYHPGWPAWSRLRGSRATPYERASFVGVLLVVVLPLLGLGLLWGLLTLPRSLARLRLLRDGQLTQATITACRFNAGWFARPLPIAEFREQWPGELARASTQGCLGCLFWPFIGLNVLGTIVLLALLGLVMFSGWSPSIDGRPVPKVEATRWLVTALALWAGSGVLFVGVSRAYGLVVGELARLKVLADMGRLPRWAGWIPTIARRRPPPRIPMPERESELEVRCTFEFAGPGGEIVQASDVALFTQALGDQPTEPVLYDPAHPRRACLLDGLTLDVRVSPSGEWEDRGAPARRNAVLAALGYAVGALVVGRAVWLFLR